MADISDQAASCLHTACMVKFTYHVGARCRVWCAAWNQGKVILHLLDLVGLWCDDWLWDVQQLGIWPIVELPLCHTDCTLCNVATLQRLSISAKGTKKDRPLQGKISNDMASTHKESGDAKSNAHLVVGNHAFSKVSIRLLTDRYVIHGVVSLRHNDRQARRWRRRWLLKIAKSLSCHGKSEGSALRLQQRTMASPVLQGWCTVPAFCIAMNVLCILFRILNIL